MAGDPKQLGPIIRSPVAIRGGLQGMHYQILRSLGEEFEDTIFKKNSVHLKDDEFITYLSMQDFGSKCTLSDLAPGAADVVGQADGLRVPA